MKKHFLTALLFTLSAPCASAQKIDIVYPVEGHIMSGGSAAYLFGNIKPPKGKLKINEVSVKVHSNGAFITYLPVKPGPFAFNCELTAGTQTVKAVRNIVVGSSFKKPDNAAVYIDTSSLSPWADIIARPGDWIYASFSGTIGQKAFFRIRGLSGELPMPETAPGSYAGAYLAQSADKAEKAEIQFRLTGALGEATALAGGKVSVRPDFSPVVEITTDSVGTRTASGAGYMLFLSAGQRLMATAKTGRTLKLKLSETLDGWVDESYVRYLPDGTPPPSSEMTTINTVCSATGTAVVIAGVGSAPWRAVETENGLEVTFFYTKNHTNWIVYDSSDTMIRDIRWRQDDNNTCTVSVNLQPGLTLWGYDVTGSQDSAIISLSRKPLLKSRPGRKLAGLKVIIDPGHSPTSAPPYDGAIGPMRTMEYQHTLEIAQMLKTELEKHGAVALTTRKSSETVPLRERPRMAARENGNLYISIHANALVDTADPYATPRGYSLYYYFPHSRSFASNMHRGMQKFIPLPDEGLRYGDYHVIRLTAMPAVLIETSYLILPEQEMLLNDEAFRMKVVNACMYSIFSTFGQRYTAPPFVRTKPKPGQETGKPGRKPGETAIKKPGGTTAPGKTGSAKKEPVPSAKTAATPAAQAGSAAKKPGKTSSDKQTKASREKPAAMEKPAGKTSAKNKPAAKTPASGKKQAK
ncbi:MAG: N-acetylmuramoyl-L-alanine amidase [Elusimicrobiaceae bacterium]|nr:N-acetylmuramoyl-L-alanine amidase [Elusimicrobiaceae bacterium]